MGSEPWPPYHHLTSFHSGLTFLFWLHLIFLRKLFSELLVHKYASQSLFPRKPNLSTTTCVFYGSKSCRHNTCRKKYWRGSTVYILCNWVSLHFPKLANSLLYGHFCQIFARWMAFVFRKIGWMLTGRRDNNYKVIDLSSKKNIGPFLKNWTKKRNLNWLLFAVSSFRIFNRLEFRDLSEVWTQGSLYTCDTFFLLSLKD